MTQTRSTLVAVALLAAVAGGCSDAGSPAPSDPLRLTRLHAEPDPVAGGRIVDTEGREVLLRGANVNALVEYWKSSDFPTTFPFTPADADRMAAIGWNAVRLLLSWSRVEPSPGAYDESYLQQVDAAIDLLKSRDIYAIVDLHQDAWGATLADRPDEVCPPGSDPAFGWDGAPGWATLDGGAARCAAAGIRETSPAVLAAWAAFWNDAPGPGGVGIRARYVEMLAMLAGRYAARDEVAGFDLMNEPNAFGATEAVALSEMYADALREIRTAEAAAGAAPHLVLFEPSAIWSSTGRGAPPDFARDRDVVYAPHIYTGGFTGGPITAEAFQIAVDEARGFGGAPVLSGEWGADPHRASDPSDGYFLKHQALQDQFRVSATLWTWRESCGDPHKAGDRRAGRIPEVWGEFEVDCRTNDVLGERVDLVDDLTRAYVRAAPGRIVQVTYDEPTGSFDASGDTPGAGVELVAFYPAGKHGVPRVEAIGLQAVRILDAPGGAVYLIGESPKGRWSFHAAP